MIKQILWLGICIYHEARGEPREGQIAVGHVILNRVRQKDKSAKDVILQPWQFSWANNNNRPAIKDYQALADCMDSAVECLEVRLEGEDLEGANHYFADYIDKPSWARNMTKVTKIGKHIFYRD